MYKIFFAHSDQKLISLYESRLASNFSFDSARNGLMALRKIRLFRPDVVVSDSRLSFVSGFGILRYIRSHRDLHSIPFLFLSDHTDLGSALGLGANDWLDKSIGPDSVLDKIYHHIKINQGVLNQNK